MGYAHNLAVDLAKICTSPICDEKLDNELDESALPYFQDIQMQFESILIQGSPSSPAISNLICRRLDRRLSKLAKVQVRTIRVMQMTLHFLVLK